MLEQALDCVQDSLLSRQVHDLAVLSNSECTDDELSWVLRSYHLPELVQDWLKHLVVGNSDG